MRINFEIDGKLLRNIQRLTGISKKSTAVRQTLSVYEREMKKKKIIQRVMEGKTDYSTSNEELEANLYN
jgi:hypothetical protein